MRVQKVPWDTEVIIRYFPVGIGIKILAWNTQQSKFSDNMCFCPSVHQKDTLPSAHPFSAKDWNNLCEVCH